MDQSTALGLQLLANSNTPGGFGSIFGKSALAAGQDYQAAQLNQQKIQQGLLAQQMAQQKMAFLGAPGGMAGPQGPQGAQPPQQAPQGQQQPDPSQGQGFIPGISPMPQQGQAFGFTQSPQAQPGPQQQQQPQQGQPNPYLSVPTQQDISSIPIGGMSPDWLARYSVAIENKNPLDAYKDVHAQQEQLAQQQMAPKLASLDYLLKSDKPSVYMQADKQLMQAWPQLATQAGLDPQKDYNDDGVRHALTFARNQFATAVGLPAVAPTNKLINKGNQQIDPVTGEVKHEEGLEDVDLGNGQHALVPQSQAIGKPKYNAQTAAAGAITDQSKEMAYQYYLQHQALPPGFSRSPAMNADIMNFISKRATQDGNTQVSILANKQGLQATQGVVNDFTKGKTAQTINGLNTAVGHMDQLDQAATALQNGNVQALNKASNFFGTQFGSSSTTNFNVIKNFAAGEVAKAVLPGGGGEHEREEIADAIKSSNSPAQLHDAISTWRNLLSSKTEALRNQWDVGTNGTQGSFDKFLLPPTKKALGIASAPTPGDHPPDIQDLLSKYGH